MDVKGVSAIVTGGASGLGEATVRALAEQGARVVVLDRQEIGQKVADSVGGVFVSADITNESEVAQAIAAAAGLGPLRVLVNCAGVGRVTRTLDRQGTPLALEKFDFVLRVNVLGTFNCIRLAAAEMAKTEADVFGQRGAILNTASVAAFDGQIGQAAYSASKGAVVGMTLPIARDLAVVGIRLNTIAPGLFDTPIYGTGAEAEAFKAKLGESVVFPRRLGHAEEFATLASELITNDYMNGEVVRLDGGIRLQPK
ncbi:SDR family NAD(P)-dependent oxidoreductase [Nocardia vinacea]|uniref:SDR family NAD(P)-dependent oxidoreductase n=1 Tax=Nocardia vinacea TaxID=96468 RepID=A0ABZ1YWS1_9NOCA|nr:SDR family NAD(P)-dependent oxidoreductase [Nocardia vinacea]